jgi:hypothetical protein
MTCRYPCRWLLGVRSPRGRPSDLVLRGVVICGWVALVASCEPSGTTPSDGGDAGVPRDASNADGFSPDATDIGQESGGQTDAGQDVPPSPDASLDSTVEGGTDASPFGGPIVQIAAGSSFTCALTAAGTVHCWGNPDLLGPASEITPRTGQDCRPDLPCGPAYTCDTARRQCVPGSPSPIAIPALSDIVEISAGQGETACARRNDGHVFCWGWNSHGEIGNGTVNPAYEIVRTPQQVLNLSDAVQIDLGLGTACALRSTGEVVCWGHNIYGQLGTGPRSIDENPWQWEGPHQGQIDASGTSSEEAWWSVLATTAIVAIGSWRPTNCPKDSDDSRRRIDSPGSLSGRHELRVQPARLDALI